MKDVSYLPYEQLMERRSALVEAHRSMYTHESNATPTMITALNTIIREHEAALKDLESSVRRTSQPSGNYHHTPGEVQTESCGSNPEKIRWNIPEQKKLSDILCLKSELQDKITALINDFEKNTGIDITEIRVDRVKYKDGDCWPIDVPKCDSIPFVKVPIVLR